MQTRKEIDRRDIKLAIDMLADIDDPATEHILGVLVDCGNEIAKLRAELDLCKPHPNCDMGCMLSYQQEANYAEKLEKELAALRNEIERLQAVAQHEMDVAEAFKAEADALRKDAELWRDLVSHQKFNNSKQVGYAINRSKERVAAMKGR